MITSKKVGDKTIWAELQFMDNYGDFCLCRLCVHHDGRLNSTLCPFHIMLMVLWNMFNVRTPVFECPNFKQKKDDNDIHQLVDW